jgi:transcriptional regulator with XRE-family HTH domain
MTSSPATRPENVVAHVAANVRRLRVRLGRTQEELAEAAGMSTIHLRRIEAGQADLRVTMLVKLAVALDCEPGRLLRPAEPVERPPGRPRRRRPR